MNYEIDNFRSQMRKGILEYCILSLIDRQEAYATEILEALRKVDLLVVEGTLYPILTRMKNAGILTYRWQESTSGPPRKYFQTTEAGHELLDALNVEWNQIAGAIEACMQTHPQPL